MIAVPFSEEQFLSVFARYNVAVWPAQIIMTVTAVVAVIVALSTSPHKGTSTGILLAVLWAWSGIVYHVMHFSSINPAALIFGTLFLAQSAFFLLAIVRGSLDFEFQRTARGVIGVILILYSWLFYPVVGWFIGHRYPAVPTFGTPCPTTIFTIGMLFWLRGRAPLYLITVPILWSIVGASATFQFGMYEDLMLPIAGGMLLATSIRARRIPLWRATLHAGSHIVESTHARR